MTEVAINVSNEPVSVMGAPSKTFPQLDHGQLQDLIAQLKTKAWPRSLYDYSSV